MRLIIFTPIIILSAMYLSSCAPRTLDPGSEKVKVSYNSSAVASNCKFMGDVSSDNVHGDLSLNATLQERELDDINFLKNEGHKLGANAVIILRHNQVVSDERRIYGRLQPATKKLRVTYDIQGKAYSCPPGVLQSLGSGSFQHPNTQKN